jgi:transposase
MSADVVQRKQPKCGFGKPLFHHKNASAHTALLVRQFLAKNAIPTLPKPAYTPDLSPPDFFLFPKLKITLKGRRFQTVEDITDANNDLKVIPQASFKQCFKKLKTWWQRCIAVQGDYFEGIIFNKLYVERYYL